ncbi:MAG TPA: NUDIX hydrolase [Victivallales bacterium]|nr:NUDIX hydrolase [Victivallales bacterium]
MKNYLIERPKLGIGVIIVNSDNKILIGKRKGSHAQYYSIPGGHLELGETFEEAAIKEIKEETSLKLINPKVISVINDLETYRSEGKHYISICMLATEYRGTPKVMEPDKCEGWQWCDPNKLPTPHFEASRQTIQCYLQNKFYLSN